VAAGTILALGGGGFSMEPRNPLLDEYILSRSRGRRPRVCFVGTASGDSLLYRARFHRAMGRLRCRPTHLSLFQPPEGSLRSFILDQDAIYVGGGNTRALLVLWREWGLDRILREAWREGIVIAGISAGSICWFEEGLSDAVVPGKLKPLSCLGFLPGSNCPHYDGEAERRPTYRRLVAKGAMAPGLAADDGVALVFEGSRFTGAVSSRPKARAWRVGRAAGNAVETEVVPILLG
jgi:dipeptidase E